MAYSLGSLLHGFTMPCKFVYIVARKTSNSKNITNNTKGNKRQQRKNAGNRNQSSVSPPNQTFRAPVARLRKARRSPGIALSHCAQKYALAIAAPFHPGARGACSPSYPAMPSFKATGFTRFTMTVGSAGVGFCAISPCLANNENCAYFTNSSYTRNDIKIVDTATALTTGVQSYTISNLPFTADQLSLAFSSDSEYVHGRIVSVGVRITYIGTTMNESGAIYLYSSPSHQNVTRIANSLGELGSLAETEVCGITRNPCELRIFPVTSDESSYNNSGSYTNKSEALWPFSNDATDFDAQVYNAGTAGVNCGSPIALIAVSGVVAGSSFLVEIVQHAEFVGTGVATMVTNSEADQRGFEIVSAASQRLPAMKNAKPQSTFISLMGDAIKEVATTVKPMALDLLKAGVTSLIL